MLKIILNPDKKLVAEIEAELNENGGYCPCVLDVNVNEKVSHAAHE